MQASRLPDSPTAYLCTFRDQLSARFLILYSPDRENPKRSQAVPIVLVVLFLLAALPFLLLDSMMAGVMGWTMGSGTRLGWSTFGFALFLGLLGMVLLVAGLRGR